VLIKKCACGKSIKGKNDLCHECLEVFGTDKAEWPEWLRFMVADLKREYEYELRHGRDLEFDEERDSDNPGMDFEDFIWENV
jgi:hypothetical protein